MREQAEGDSSRDHRVAHFDHLALAAEVDGVEGELHKEGVDAVAGCDEQPLAGGRLGVMEQAGFPLGAGIGDIGGRRQDGTRVTFSDEEH